jgi:hypothetical protein
LLVIFFFASSWHHALSSHVFFHSKIIFTKSIFVFTNYPNGLIKSSTPFLFLKLKQNSIFRSVSKS